MLQKIRWFLLIIGVLLVVIIALQNRSNTRVDVLMYSIDMPLTLLLLATSAASFVFGALTTVWMLKRGSGSRGHKPTKPQPATPKDA